MPRMNILNGQEREAFESPPHFDDGERQRFFSLPPAFDGAVDGLKTPTNQVCFIVAAGCFQARRKFFSHQFRPPISRSSPANGAWTPATCFRPPTTSRPIPGIGPFDAAARDSIALEIAALVRVQRRPKLVFMEAAQILSRQKIALPSYFVLSTLVTTATARRQRELCGAVERHLRGSAIDSRS